MPTERECPSRCRLRRCASAAGSPGVCEDSQVATSRNWTAVSRPMAGPLWRGLFQSQFLDPGNQGRGLEAEQFGRAARPVNFPAGLVESGEGIVAFTLPQFDVAQNGRPGSNPGGWRKRRGRRCPLVVRQVKPKHAILGEDQGAFDHVLQFAHVAGPIMFLELGDMRLGEPGGRQLEFANCFLQEMRRQQRDVLFAFPQRGHFDRERH